MPLGSSLARPNDEIATLPEGADWDAVKQNVVDAIGELGDGAEQRAELLLRTHNFAAYQAGVRASGQKDADTTHWQYLATEDDHVRDTHLALNGIVRPKDDPFWDDHFPPWEWGCRCRVRPMNQDLVERSVDRCGGHADHAGDGAGDFAGGGRGQCGLTAAVVRGCGGPAGE